jgi:hypothetical protein
VDGGFFLLPDLLIGCFDSILDLCIFLKMMRCQLISDGQKTPLLHPIRMAVALLKETVVLPYLFSFSW